MPHYSKTDLCEGTDAAISNDVKWYIISHYYFFNHEFEI